MLQCLQLKPGMAVLDVGCGSGYPALVLAHVLGPHGVVYGVEVQQLLVQETRHTLGELGAASHFAPIILEPATEIFGLPGHAPYDAIHVACACPELPAEICAQLALGGRLICPVGEQDQRLILVIREQDGSLQQHDMGPVDFVPRTHPEP